jgi:hypothetical protein
MTGDELRARLSRDESAGARAIDVETWANGPGERYGEHRHGYDKVLVCDAGSITFALGSGAAVTLAGGDRLDLPAETDHRATVGPEGVRCLEAHLPSGTLKTVAHRTGWAASSEAPRTGATRGA